MSRRTVPAQIEVKKPSKDPGDFISRKFRYTMLLQGFVDVNGLFMHSFAGWPGKSSDARLYRVSGILPRPVARRGRLRDPFVRGEAISCGFSALSSRDRASPRKHDARVPRRAWTSSVPPRADFAASASVSYTHLTLPTNREV